MLTIILVYLASGQSVSQSSNQATVAAIEAQIAALREQHAQDLQALLESHEGPLADAEVDTFSSSMIAPSVDRGSVLTLDVLNTGEQPLLATQHFRAQASVCREFACFGEQGFMSAELQEEQIEPFRRVKTLAQSRADEWTTEDNLFVQQGEASGMFGTYLKEHVLDTGFKDHYRQCYQQPDLELTTVCSNSVKVRDTGGAGGGKIGSVPIAHQDYSSTQMAFDRLFNVEDQQKQGYSGDQIVYPPEYSGADPAGASGLLDVVNIWMPLGDDVLEDNFLGFIAPDHTDAYFEFFPTEFTAGGDSKARNGTSVAYTNPAPATAKLRSDEKNYLIHYDDELQFGRALLFSSVLQCDDPVSKRQCPCSSMPHFGKGFLHSSIDNPAYRKKHGNPQRRYSAETRCGIFVSPKSGKPASP